ncbi:caspase-10 [Trichosurus vulpecula]|uniref:caspase-10 n=1 Tax=Trichosurus vulpecula TaxID=9337 RepID=UPI00186B086A|nr:caspase-10 [Trichosurus vulpecula]XP_036613795.1 caspase-10 [Trichosurus vulpecula]
MEEDNNIEFHQKFLLIDEKLERKDVESLKFLCSDLISPKNLEGIDTAHQLFQKFMDEDLLNEDDCFLVAELLFLIKQHYLLQHIGYTKEKVQKELSTKGKISSYRVMLYNLHEEVTKEDFEYIKFLLHKDIPKSLVSFLSLLRHMEKKEFLSENNLDMLERVCTPLSANLIRRINQYKDEKKERKLSVASGATESLWKKAAEENKEGVQYTMGRRHRGLCLIFDNSEFQTMDFREGSCKDVDELTNVFEWLGFIVRIHCNTTKEEMEKILILCSTDPKHEDSDCFVCFVLSHGDSGSVFSSDEKSIAILDITSYFRARPCPGLINKPKLFFFQACQGEDMQEAVPLDADARSASASLPVPKNIPQRCIPKEADFLLGMATVDGCCAIRHRIKGSWYIQALCHQLKCLVPRREDILTILTVVNDVVSQQADPSGKIKQMPQPAFTLRKKVIFPVPPDAPPASEENLFSP